MSRCSTQRNNQHCVIVADRTRYLRTYCCVTTILILVILVAVGVLVGVFVGARSDNKGELG